MGEMLVQITPHDVCYLQPPYDRETSATFTARARSMSVPVCYKMLAFKSDKISVRVEETKVIVNGKETWHNPSRIENQDEVSADSGRLEPKETRVFKVTLESGYDPSVSTDPGFDIIFAFAPAALAKNCPDWWKDQTFRVDYGDHVRIEFEMMPPLGMLPNPRRINRVLSLLGKDPQLDQSQLVDSTAAEGGNAYATVRKPEVEAERPPKPSEQVGQGFTEEECQREMKIIEGLFEKMVACEENMEKLFAASLEALDRAEGLNKREL